jgi:hypothetical protein
MLVADLALDFQSVCRSSLNPQALAYSSLLTRFQSAALACKLCYHALPIQLSCAALLWHLC